MSLDNAQAKLIVSHFYAQLNTLKTIIESNLSDELINEIIPLTKREFEILEHVSNGYTNKEIASALSVGPKTIEFHMKSILQKTESSSRTEAVKNAIKPGWIKVVFQVLNLAIRDCPSSILGISWIQ